jgi:hypothetical protein
MRWVASSLQQSSKGTAAVKLGYDVRTAISLADDRLKADI